MRLINADADGTYLAGSFTGSADFYGTLSTADDLTSAGAEDIFFMKLDSSNGNTLWAKRVGGAGSDLGNDLDVAGCNDPQFPNANCVYATGSFYQTVDFDPGPGTANLTTAGKGKFRGPDAFVLKLTGDLGKYAGAWRIGGPELDQGHQIIVDGDTLFLGCIFVGTVDFGPGPGVVNRSSAHGRSNLADWFFASYTTSMGLNWVQHINAGPTWTLASDANNLYMTTSFLAVTNPLDVDPSDEVYNLSANGVGAGVVAKYAKADGSLVWAKELDSLSSDGGVGVGNAAFESMYVFGTYNGTVDLDPGAGIVSPPPSTTTNAYVLKLNPATGDYVSHWHIGTPDVYTTARPAVVFGDTLYVTGSFGPGTTSFPTGESLTSAGDVDVYILALDQTTTASAATGTTSTFSSSTSPVPATCSLPIAPSAPNGPSPNPRRSLRRRPPLRPCGPRNPPRAA
ncbi:MAG: hypothetical protein HY000_39660 [Planctomycetes bacterium]|nr:hypothetical protein [Planctomycetota bacterium]